MTSINELSKEFEGAREEYEKIKKDLAKRGQDLIKKTAKQIFDSDPDLREFYWDQYTPYWNDGDACVFGLHEPTITWEPEDGPEVVAEYGYMPDDDESFTEQHRKTGAAIEELWGFLEKNKEIALDVFDDHVTVTVGRDGIETSECAHD